MSKEDDVQNVVHLEDGKNAAERRTPKRFAQHEPTWTPTEVQALTYP